LTEAPAQGFGRIFLADFRRKKEKIFSLPYFRRAFFLCEKADAASPSLFRRLNRF
jgi:hypothetical protein